MLFLGREWDLLMLDILVFGICDLWFDSTAASILLVYLTGWALGELRAYLGQVSSVVVLARPLFKFISCVFVERFESKDIG